RPTVVATASVTDPVRIAGTNPDPTGLAERCKGSAYKGPPIVEALIGENGLVRDVKVKRSCGCGAGDQMLVDAIKGWKYRPGLRDGKPVAASLTVVVNHYWW